MPRPDERANEVRSAILVDWRGNPLSRERGEFRLEVSERPELISNRAGEVGGILVPGVKLYRGDVEQAIDPTRRFWNPPLVPRAGISAMTPNPKEALWDVLWDSIKSTPNPERWRTRGTVTTIFGDNSDGYISSTNAAYATARSGGTLAANIVATPVLGQTLSTNYFCYEGFFAFDTSSIPDLDTVSAAVFSLFGVTDNSATDFTFNARLVDWGVDLTTADWIAGASLSANTLLATWATSGFLADYNAFTSQAAFPANVNLTGFTRLVVGSSRQEGNNAPTGNESVSFRGSDTSGTVNDPKLDITHVGTGKPQFWAQYRRRHG